MNKKKLKLLIPIFMLFGFVFANSTSLSAFQEGCTAYARGDWDNAVFLLKKATAYEENQLPDTYYMLITSEIYAGDNSGALDDCEYFLANFSDSILKSKICYLRGRILYNLGDYESAILVLSDFCHEYEKDEMYSQALFYIGESLYAGYKYDEASSVYENIISNYPESSKVSAAQYRLDSILQRSREEKLLYLLKQTGEEYLSAKEDYEKQLKMYNADSVNSTRKKLSEAQKKNQELEQKIIELENQLAQIHSKVEEQNQSELNKVEIPQDEKSEIKKSENEKNDEKKEDNQNLEEVLENSQEKIDKTEDSITVHQLKLKAELLKMMINNSSPYSEDF